VQPLSLTLRPHPKREIFRGVPRSESVAIMLRIPGRNRMTRTLRAAPRKIRTEALCGGVCATTQKKDYLLTQTKNKYKLIISVLGIISKTASLKNTQVLVLYCAV